MHGRKVGKAVQREDARGKARHQQPAAAVEGRAGDLLAQLEGLEPGKGDSPALSEAKGFLLDMLTGGPMLTTALTAEAKGAGISPASLRRAKDALGVQAEKAPGDGPWRWRLPERSP
jgi:hypothetical protein